MSAEASKPSPKLEAQFISAVARSGVSSTELAKRSGWDRSTINNVLSKNNHGSIRFWNDILETLAIEVTLWPIFDEGEGTSA